jgi:hypothetical protein
MEIDGGIPQNRGFRSDNSGIITFWARGAHICCVVGDVTRQLIELDADLRLCEAAIEPTDTVTKLWPVV